MSKRFFLKLPAAAVVLLAVILTECFFTAIPGFSKPGDIGEPLSSFNRGSVKKLTGKNVIVSLFADTMYSRWEEEEKRETLEKLRTACGYLEEEAKEAGVPLELVYDWQEEPELSRSGRVFFPINEDTCYSGLLDRRIAFWLGHTVSYEKLLRKYRADGIAMMIHFRQEGRSYAICFDGEDIYKETMVVFRDANAASYAHELLHLFGAHDLYEGAEYTDDCVSYIMEHYPNELMLTVTEKDPKRITQKISPITAYHIGWTDDLPELALYPQLER
ncbi:MAG: hypothetical protein K6F53_02795 [Lachnospiraceae bacterium]|nr:hypothetical protein [Lachnospiraceae bacterium]